MAIIFIKGGERLITTGFIGVFAIVSDFDKALALE